MKLTKMQHDALKLIERSPDSGDGWRICAPRLFAVIAEILPDSLAEKDHENKRIRLTLESHALLKWL